ncbi:hypothetical protein EON79_23405, partial [bacterium]
MKRTPGSDVRSSGALAYQHTMAFRMKSLAFGTVVALSTFALAAQGGPTLTRKVKSGDELKYRLKATIEVGGQEAQFSGLQTQKIVEVAPDGTYTVQAATSDVKAVFGGQDIAVPEGTIPSITTVYNVDGTVKEIRGDSTAADTYRSSNLATVFYTGKEVKVGDTYNNDKAADSNTGAVAYKSTYKVVGEE